MQNKPPYEILEHTADVGLKVYGRTLPELFVNAAGGLMSLVSAGQENGPKPAASESLALSVRGDGLEELLVNWLSEILYFVDAEGWLFAEFRVRRVATNAVEGEGVGERRGLAAGGPVNPVKAVTYHQLSVREVPGGWEAVVYFDI